MPDFGPTAFCLDRRQTRHDQTIITNGHSRYDSIWTLGLLRFSPLNWERKITEGLTGNLRATYSEKPGGFSAYTVTDSQITFLEEETLSYEIGLLFAPTESWGLNLTAYLNDIENYQFELPTLTH